MRVEVDLRSALASRVSDPARVVDGSSERDLHAADLTFHVPKRPDVVVYPTSTDEVAAVLAFADANGVAVTPFGAGTSLEGHVIPERAGISLDLTRMDRVLELQPADLTAVVQPGVTRSALSRAAGVHGLFFPIDPGADATLGGMAATNAGGTTTIRYGKMRANVLALEAVLPGGAVIRTGSRAAKTSAGYDLTGLLVGSEGTLGVITELTLRLHGIPEHAVALRIAFATLEDACRTAAELVAVGSGVSRLELLDADTVQIVNGYHELSYPVAPCLFVEASGSEQSVGDDLELIRALALDAGAVHIVEERDPDARAQLWRARHDVAHAFIHAFPGKRHRTTDVCVPVSELAGALTYARAAAEAGGVLTGVIAHAGDGNFHLGLMLDPDDPAEVAASDELVALLVADALARGGTSTGEHGVGIGKIAALEIEHGDLLPLMRGIKRVFDPNGIMNPGKILTGD